MEKTIKYACKHTGKVTDNYDVFDILGIADADLYDEPSELICPACQFEVDTITAWTAGNRDTI